MEDSSKGIELELGADLPPGAQKVLEALYKTARYKIQCNKGLLGKRMYEELVEFVLLIES